MKDLGKKPSVVVYTAVTDGYDSIKPINSVWAMNARFVAFVESGETKGWERRELDKVSADASRNAKRPKILSHSSLQECDYSIWVDGSVTITSTIPVMEFLDEALGSEDMALFKHRRRDCVYKEAIACMVQGKDSDESILRQMRKYWREGYPKHAGLSECTILVRRHTDVIKKCNEMWYDEICKGSKRDQLSFNYIARKTGVRYAWLAGTVSRNEHFGLESHSHPFALRATHD